MLNVHYEGVRSSGVYVSKLVKIHVMFVSTVVGVIKCF